MKKRIFILIGLVGAVVIIAIVGVVLYANTMAARGIERGSEHALGVRTSVGAVDLGLLSGSFGMSSLKVRNPKGFESDNFLALQDTDLSIDLWSVLEDTVVVDRLTFDGIEMNLEMRNRDSNFGAILDNLRRFQKGGRAEKDQNKKRLVIDELVITGVVARLSASSPELGIDKEAVIQVPDIRLTGVGRRNGGVTVSEIASIVVTRILDAAMRSDNGLPAEIRMMIQNEVSYLLDGQEALIAGAKKSGRDEIDKAAQSIVDKATETVSDTVDN